jgi:hypothetical protein
VHINLGLIAVSSHIPRDLKPRIGAGGNAGIRMRARSDLDREGVVLALFPGTAWVHGGVEWIRPVGSLGPIGVGVAAFADGIWVLARGRPLTAAGAERGAIHLGAGARARIPGIDGWLRVDWAIDPTDRAFAFSAAWSVPSIRWD